MVEKLLSVGKFGEWVAFITDGFRSYSEQDALYAQGRTKAGKIVTNAKGGQSMHNFGLAVDIAFKNISGEMRYEVGWLEQMAKAVKDIGIEWGGYWESFKDYPHFQYTGGLTLADLQNGKRPAMQHDSELAKRFEGKAILVVDDAGKCYAVINGKKVYWAPELSLNAFNRLHKFALGISKADADKIPNA